MNNYCNHHPHHQAKAAGGDIEWGQMSGSGFQGGKKEGAGYECQMSGEEVFSAAS
jgi:hypothetical protein